jgi:hypothetical protein
MKVVVMPAKWPPNGALSGGVRDLGTGTALQLPLGHGGHHPEDDPDSNLVARKTLRRAI